MSNKRNNCAEVISPDNKIYPCNLLKMLYLFAKGRWQHLQPLINYGQINFFSTKDEAPKAGFLFESHWKTLGYPAPDDSKFSQAHSTLCGCWRWLSDTATIDITERSIQSSRGLLPSTPLTGLGRGLRAHLIWYTSFREPSITLGHKLDSPWPSRRCLLLCIFEKASLSMQAGLQITAILLSQHKHNSGAGNASHQTWFTSRLLRRSLLLQNLFVLLFQAPRLAATCIYLSKLIFGYHTK